MLKKISMRDRTRSDSLKQTIVDFGHPATMDKDVVCSQIDRAEFKAFVRQQGGSDLGKTVWLIDYIMAKDIYKSVRVSNLTKINAQSLTIA